MDLVKEIAAMAYELYEKSGKAEGRDDDNWFEAERMVMALYRKEDRPKAGSSSPLKEKKQSSARRSVGKAGTRGKKK